MSSSINKSTSSDDNMFFDINEFEDVSESTSEGLLGTPNTTTDVKSKTEDCTKPTELQSCTHYELDTADGKSEVNILNKDVNGDVLSNSKDTKKVNDKKQKKIDKRNAKQLIKSAKKQCRHKNEDVEKLNHKLNLELNLLERIGSTSKPVLVAGLFGVLAVFGCSYYYYVNRDLPTTNVNSVVHASNPQPRKSDMTSSTKNDSNKSSSDTTVNGNSSSEVQVDTSKEGSTTYDSGMQVSSGETVYPDKTVKVDSANTTTIRESVDKMGKSIKVSSGVRSALAALDYNKYDQFWCTQSGTLTIKNSTMDIVWKTSESIRDNEFSLKIYFTDESNPSDTYVDSTLSLLQSFLTSDSKYAQAHDIINTVSTEVKNMQSSGQLVVQCSNTVYMADMELKTLADPLNTAKTRECAVITIKENDTKSSSIDAPLSGGEDSEIPKTKLTGNNKFQSTN